MNKYFTITVFVNRETVIGSGAMPRVVLNCTIVQFQSNIDRYFNKPTNKKHQHSARERKCLNASLLNWIQHCEKIKTFFDAHFKIVTNPKNKQTRFNF